MSIVIFDKFPTFEEVSETMNISLETLKEEARCEGLSWCTYFKDGEDEYFVVNPKILYEVTGVIVEGTLMKEVPLSWNLKEDK